MMTFATVLHQVVFQESVLICQSSNQILWHMILKRVFKLVFYYFCLCFSVCACVYMFAHVYKCPQKPEECIRLPGSGVTGGCEQSIMDSEK